MVIAVARISSPHDPNSFAWCIVQDADAGIPDSVELWVCNDMWWTPTVFGRDFEHAHERVPSCLRGSLVSASPPLNQEAYS